jgi:hypothetical protein
LIKTDYEEGRLQPTQAGHSQLATPPANYFLLVKCSISGDQDEGLCRLNVDVDFENEFIAVFRRMTQEKKESPDQISIYCLRTLKLLGSLDLSTRPVYPIHKVLGKYLIRLPGDRSTIDFANLYNWQEGSLVKILTRTFSISEFTEYQLSTFDEAHFCAAIIEPERRDRKCNGAFVWNLESGNPDPMLNLYPEGLEQWSSPCFVPWQQRMYCVCRGSIGDPINIRGFCLKSGTEVFTSNLDPGRNLRKTGIIEMLRTIENVYK